MELIKISNTVLVNPAHISSVEFRKNKRGNELVVLLSNNRTLPVSISLTELRDQFRKSGVDAHDQFFGG